MKRSRSPHPARKYSRSSPADAAVRSRRTGDRTGSGEGFVFGQDHRRSHFRVEFIKPFQKASGTQCVAVLAVTSLWTSRQALFSVRIMRLTRMSVHSTSPVRSRSRMRSESEADPAGTDHGRGGHTGRVYGNCQRRPQPPPRTDRKRWSRVGQSAVITAFVPLSECSAIRPTFVRRHRDERPRQCTLNDTRGSEKRCRRDHRQGEGSKQLNFYGSGRQFQADKLLT